MSGIELNKINNYIVNKYKMGLKSNLYAIIFDGSLAFNEFHDYWSDIDLILVVEDISFDAKQVIAQVKEELENMYNKHFGINVILKSELINPIKPIISLDGKTLQALLELNLYPKRLIFIKNNARKFYVPTKSEIKKYSLSNILMFLLHSRKDLIGKELKTMDELKKKTEKEIRAAFIITKLAIQYKSFYICKNKIDLLKKAKELFSNYDFQVLQENELIIKNWQNKKTKSQLFEILKNNNKYIEEFSKYFLKCI